MQAEQITLDDPIDILEHHGVKGMRWGVRRTPEQLGHTSASGIQKSMQDNIKYSDFTTLKSHDQVASEKKGSCHDQVMYALDELRAIGKEPKAMFFIEYRDGEPEGGTTHSLVYYNEGGKTKWLENAWGGQEGIHTFNNVSEIIDTIQSKHNAGEFGDSSKYPDLQFANFDDSKHTVGESLSELVQICLNDPIDILEHQAMDDIEALMYYFGDEEDLIHYGMKFRSGRYPYGSGEEPYQHSKDFLGRIAEKRAANFTWTDEKGKTWTGDTAIAKSMGLTSDELRIQIGWANYESKMYKAETAKALQKDGLGPTEIGRKMDLPESTVRGLLKDDYDSKIKKSMETVNFLYDKLQETGMIDVGAGVDRELGISNERMKLALDYLTKVEGCHVYEGGIPQPTNPGQQTTQKVLTLPDKQHKDIYNYDQVKSVTEYTSHDDGQTFEKYVYPKSMDSSRIMVRYKEDGGEDRDGIIEIRRNVDDLSLNGDKYAQVRILVDDNYYLKGMAVYSDDLPKGVDVVFNTNKSNSVDKLDTFKTIGEDPDNPFGTTIPAKGQHKYVDKDGNEQLSVVNKCRSEGEWDEWKNNLPSQFLGKQSSEMAEKQLNLAKTIKMEEYDAICELNNPTIKKHLLEKFADECDSAAVHLQAAALPGQKHHVILPINTLKDTEVYAPNYTNGTKLALVRYPHAGTFEIPILTVNNKNALGDEWISKQSIDAIGLTKKVADRLSGADFDGDTVMCIPTHDRYGKVKVTSTEELSGLKGFDGKLAYGYDKVTEDADGTKHYYRNGNEFKVMQNKGKEMGVISNLITDMTLIGASDDEMVRAVKHSMVVIDAQKHKLDYKASEIENNIDALKQRYQIKVDADGTQIGYGGASTIISKAKGEYNVDKRQGEYKVNVKGTDYYDPDRPEGAKLWKTTKDLYYPERVNYDKETGIVTYRTADSKKVSYNVNDKDAVDRYAPVRTEDGRTGEVTYTSRDGSIVYKTSKRHQQITKMEGTDDAHTLVSAYKHPMETLYADYANSMKSLGNKARLEMVSSGKIAVDASAKKIYANEVKSLMSKLAEAESNRPKERAAIRLTNAEVNAKKAANPNLKDDKEAVRKLSQQAVTKYRTQLGVATRKKRNIDITDKEWEAIQAGAVSESRLKRILNNTDIDKLRERATPRTTTTLSSAKIALIKGYANSNYTLKQIADKLGVSTSTVSKYMKGA